jgi:heme A synthase
MQKNFGIIFGGVVAYILLGLYTGTVLHIIWGVLSCAKDPACKQMDFTDGITYVVTTIGGLVSALVISKLTLTEPGENPAIIRDAQRNKEIGWATNLALAYLAVWLITGLSALIIGVMIHPNINSTLSDIGTTWLGLAVASGYAYFGLKPPN